MMDVRIAWREGANWPHKDFENLTRAFDFRRDLLQLGNLVGVYCYHEGEWTLMGSGFATATTGDPYDGETYHGDVRGGWKE